MAGMDLSVARAAFRVGRRLNQIRWQAEIACLWLDPAANTQTQSLLADLRAEVLPLLAQQDRPGIDSAILRAREEFASLLRSERYAEQAYNEAMASLTNLQDSRPRQDIRADAYAALLQHIGFLMPTLEDTIVQTALPAAQPWLAVGKSLDQGMRPPIADEMARSAPAGQLVGDIPRPGALPAPAGWQKMTWQLWREALVVAAVPGLGDALPETRWMAEAPADLVAAVNAEFARFVPPAAAAGPQLTGIQKALLNAMYGLRAFDADHLKSFDAIVRAALGEQTDYNNYKEYATDLKQKGLIDSRRGAAGGYWLTAAGKAIAAGLRNR